MGCAAAARRWARHAPAALRRAVLQGMPWVRADVAGRSHGRCHRLVQAMEVCLSALVMHPLCLEIA